GVRLPDRVVRAGDSQAAACQLAGALPVDRSCRPALLPEPRQSGSARRRVWVGGDARLLHEPRGAGACAGDSAVQVGCAVADERCHAAALRSQLVTVGGGAGAVGAVGPEAKPALGRGFRLQWEPAQQAHVLLYPEGMVKLNGSAGEILKRCDGVRTVAEIVSDLEFAFATTGLAKDVTAFMGMALEKRWLEIRE